MQALSMFLAAVREKIGKLIVCSIVYEGKMKLKLTSFKCRSNSSKIVSIIAILLVSSEFASFVL